jgi:CRP-like cAMP-binding protein
MSMSGRDEGSSERAAERRSAPPLAAEPPELDQLREIGLFGGLGDQVLTDYVQRLPTITLEPGDVVFREGELGRELYVLLSGEMEIVKKGSHQREARVAMLGPGDWFGEMAILDVMPRSATARALAPSTLIRMGAQDLDGLYRRDLKSYAIIVLNIAREMSRRLRVADGLLAEVMSYMASGYERNR